MSENTELYQNIWALPYEIQEKIWRFNRRYWKTKWSNDVLPEMKEKTNKMGYRCITYIIKRCHGGISIFLMDFTKNPMINLGIYAKTSEDSFKERDMEKYCGKTLQRSYLKFTNTIHKNLTGETGDRYENKQRRHANSNRMKKNNTQPKISNTKYMKMNKPRYHGRKM
jgi:hypothetical protein